jgi:long-chain acyl-CoA synthetase
MRCALASGLRLRKSLPQARLVSARAVLFRAKNAKTLEGSIVQMQPTQPWRAFYPPGVSADFPPPPFATLPDLFADAVQRYGSRRAFTMMLPNGSSASLSYNDVDDRSARFAVYLREVLKLKAGARVAVMMPNCLAYPIVAFGILRAGCVLVNTNPLYTEPEVTKQFTDAEVSAAVVIDMFADRLHPSKIPSLQHIILAGLADLFALPRRLLIGFVLKYVRKQVPTPNFAFVPFSAALKAAPHADAQPYGADIQAHSIAALQYTGGTTGAAKGAMLTHSNLVANTLQSFRYVGHTLIHGQEVGLSALPIYHIFAFTVNLLGMFHIGCTNVLVPSPRPLTNLKRVFEQQGITLLTGVNTLFNGLLNEPWFQQNPPRSLKLSVAGGMALHHSVAERWPKLLNSLLVEGYGLTEASPVVCFNPCGGRVKLDSIGLPVPGTDCRILGDDGTALPPGQRGELAVFGPQVMTGYWRQPEETAKVLQDGWLLTGDIAVMDDEGYFHIVDRKKDMILVSGFNVYPNEVEDCIAKLDGVAEVAVVGVADATSGELVKAFIVRKDPSLTVAQVRDHCKRSLTGYKVPKQVEFRDELPKSPVGKILRKDLRRTP